MRKTKPRKEVSLRTRILGLFKAGKGFEEPLDEERDARSSLSAGDYQSYRKEVETAWLEADRKKAEALMEWQRRRSLW